MKTPGSLARKCLQIALTRFAWAAVLAAALHFGLRGQADIPVHIFVYASLAVGVGAGLGAYLFPYRYGLLPAPPVQPQTSDLPKKP